MAAPFIPNINNAYSFKFDTKYASANGIYRVDRIMSYDEYVADGNDIVADFYDACGLTDDDAANDMAILRSSIIIKVSPPDDNTSTIITHIPFCFVSDTPDFNVHQYTTFGLVLYSGITDDVRKFEYLREHVAQLFHTSIGIDARPHWVAIGTQWMTKDAYDALVAEQNQQANKALNYVSENLRLQKHTTSLENKVTAYEDIIVKLQKQVDALKAQINSGEVSS